MRDEFAEIAKQAEAGRAAQERSQRAEAANQRARLVRGTWRVIPGGVSPPDRAGNQQQGHGKKS
jgi:hypothetical protein